MPIHLPMPKPATLLMLGCLCSVLGLVWLLLRGSSRAIHLLITVLILCGSFIATGILLPEASIELLVLLCAGATGIAILVRYHVFQRAFQGLARLQRIETSGVILLLAGTLAIYLSALKSEPEPASLFESTFDDPSSTGRSAARHWNVHAFTDAGTEVPVFYESRSYPLDWIVRSESRTLATPRLQEKVIRLADASTDCNCHGWVFTGGQHWLDEKNVDMILAENGYQRVEKPQPDDVIIYRDEGGTVTHTGLVRAVWENGRRVMVEGKWGFYGVFLHLEENSIYGTMTGYYRSARGSDHILTGLARNNPLRTVLTTP